MGSNEWWQRGISHHDRGETHTLGRTHTIDVTIGGESDGMDSLKAGYERYKAECEENKQHLKERFEEKKGEYRNENMKYLKERYAEKKKQSEEEDRERLRERYAEKNRETEENKQRLKERYEERKSGKGVK